MSNRAAYGPGQGAVAFDRVGPWRTQPSDAANLGAPLVFTSGTSDWPSEYGVLYKITICGGGGGGTNAGPALGGGSGGAAQFWWVGTGERASITIGGGGGAAGTGGTSSFTVSGKTLVSVSGGVSGGAGGSVTLDSSLTGRALSIPGRPATTEVSVAGTPYPSSRGGDTGFGLGIGAPTSSFNPSGYGAGGGGDPAVTVAGSSGANGVCIIEKVLPALNSQAGPWTPSPGVL